VPPGFGQDVREWQMKKQLFPSHQAPSGLDISRPPSSLDCPMSPGETTARLTVKDVERHRIDDVWEGDNGEQGGEPTEEQAQICIGTPADRGLVSA
jgi:Transcriptional regulator containing GAF, AAA-type ATPase, and DNA binding domains